LSAAIRSLPAIAGLQALSLQRASSFADFEQLQQVANTAGKATTKSKNLVEADAVLGFLHQPAPHPAIPAHMRASTTFHRRQQQQK
jgi:hypothetical protein